MAGEGVAAEEGGAEAPRNFGGRDSWLIVATTLFIIWAAAALGVRIYAKLRSRELWGHDDSTIALAATAMVAQVTVTYVAIRNGYGKRPDEPQNLDVIEKLLFVGQIFYILTVGMTRVSSAFFIRRLTRIRAQVLTARIIIYSSGLWIGAGILICSLRGDLSAPWRTLDGTYAMLYRWIGVEVTGFVLECALWALAVQMIWHLNMAVSKRLIVISAFSGRLLLVGIFIARLVFLAPMHNPEPVLYSSIVQAIITQAALQFSLIAACLPCFSPLLRPFHSDFVVSTAGPHYGATGGGKAPDSYLMLSKSKDRTVALGSGSRMSSRVNNKSYSKSPLGTRYAPRSETIPDESFRGDFVDSHGTARMDSSSGEGSIEKGSEDHGDTDDMVIRQTTTFLVSEEKVKRPR